MKQPHRLTGIVATLSVLALAACGGGDSPPAAGGPNSVDLRMTVWTSAEPHLALFNEIGAAYNATHPEIKSITFEPVPFDSYTTSLTTQIAGGNVPDLAWIFESSAPDFVSSGALVDLKKPLSEAKGYNYADILPTTTKLWEKDGGLYAYPFSTSPFGVFVNTDLMESAGQQAPKELITSGTWNWDKAYSVAAAVKADTGKAGLVVRDFDFKNWDNLASVWRGWGADPWSEEGKACTMASTEMANALTSFHKAVFVDKGVPGPGETADFFAGDAGMTITQVSRASLLKDAKFNWDLVPLPSGPAGEYAVVGQAGIGVLKQGKHAQNAADFLAFFSNEENSAKLAAFFPPPRKSQLTAQVLAKANPMLSEAQLQSVVISGIEKGKTKASHTGMAELSQEIRAGLDAIWKPQANVDASLNELCTSVTPLLKD